MEGETSTLFSQERPEHVQTCRSLSGLSLGENGSQDGLPVPSSLRCLLRLIRSSLHYSQVSFRKLNSFEYPEFHNISPGLTSTDRSLSVESKSPVSTNYFTYFTRGRAMRLEVVLSSPHSKPYL